MQTDGFVECIKTVTNSPQFQKRHTTLPDAFSVKSVQCVQCTNMKKVTVVKAQMILNSNSR